MRLPGKRMQTVKEEDIDGDDDDSQSMCFHLVSRSLLPPPSIHHVAAAASAFPVSLLMKRVKLDNERRSARQSIARLTRENRRGCDASEKCESDSIYERKKKNVSN